MKGIKGAANVSNLLTSKLQLGDLNESQRK